MNSFDELRLKSGIISNKVLWGQEPLSFKVFSVPKERQKSQYDGQRTGKAD
jgi:hypothetical protein